MSNPDNAKPTHDPDLYARMSEPKTEEAFEAARLAFFADLSAARERHGLQEVVVVVAHPIKGADGPTCFTVVMHRGSSEAVPVMLAAALGAVRSKREGVLDELAGRKRTPRRTQAR